jgi:hypothetical protein
MRCRIGDLAVIEASPRVLPCFVGIVITVVRFVGHVGFLDVNGTLVLVLPDAWLVSRISPCPHCGLEHEHWFSDLDLRPIRGTTEGERDETGLPRDLVYA